MQAALNAANAGTHALESAANSISGVVADLDTMIIFASAGTLEADEEGDSFAGMFIRSLNFEKMRQYITLKRIKSPIGLSSLLFNRSQTKNLGSFIFVGPRH